MAWQHLLSNNMGQLERFLSFESLSEKTVHHS